MEITFATSKLQKLFNSEKKLRGEYGDRMAALIQQRMVELADADVLDDMRHVVGARCHELSQNLKGLLAVDLVHPQRMTFKVADKPVPKKPDGGLNWLEVRQIEVVGVGDYH